MVSSLIALGWLSSLKTYAARRTIPASGIRESCLGPVFPPLTNSIQYSFQILICQMDVPTFSRQNKVTEIYIDLLSELIVSDDGTNLFPIDLITNTTAENPFSSAFLLLSSVGHACTWTQYFKNQIKTIPRVAFWNFAVSQINQPSVG